MSESRELRATLKKFEKELQKSRREAERALAMTQGALYKCTFIFASIKLTDGALTLLGNKLRDIGTVLAFNAELMALKKGKKSIDKRTMKAALDELEEAAKEEYDSQNSIGKGWPKKGPSPNGV